ncbi:MAG TPA: CCA tRNA nucleotidyltransferase [Allosphingosinicella sp.]|nr:CCA tRNA nucleotidyltransferase [Allosphingosinicella sp.]
MKLPRAAWRARPELRRLLDVLGARAGETRFVGGCVRDTLLGFAVSDVDLATRIAPEAVLGRLGDAGIKAVPTGIAHGTVTAVIEGRPVEVTTLRRDVATDGRRATIAYTDDWREDAARRDFTINALTADPASGAVFDYFDGLADLEARHVRFIGDPFVRIAEDHLRILRFFRFHARFGGGDPDAAALDACTKRANDLMALSRERISDELLKLLALPNPAPTAGLMIARGILRPVLPEIVDAGSLERLVEAEAATGVAPHPLRRLAALLPRDPDTVGAIATRLRLSKRRVKRLTLAAGTETGDPRRLAYRIGPEGAVDRLLLGGATEGDLAALELWQPPRLPISGGELIALGLTAGPEVARTLQAIEREWEAAGFPADKATVRAIAARLIAEALGRSSRN